MHAVAGGLEHRDRGPGVVRLEPGGEGVGEQDHVAPIAGESLAVRLGRKGFECQRGSERRALNPSARSDMAAAPGT